MPKRKAGKSKTVANGGCPRGKGPQLRDVIHPMLATVVDEPFSDPEWIFETKWDGFRAGCFIDKGSMRLVSRNQIEMTPQYPELAKLPMQFAAKQAIIDGEIVALDERGMPRFQLLQNKLRLRSGSYAAGGKAQIVYFVFDLLYLDGYDLTACPLVERKALLEQIIKPEAFVKYSDHIEAEGEEFFRHIEKFRLEGMMAKRAASPYIQNKRSSDWLKVKTVLRSEVVIGGYTQPRGARSYFGSLVVGLYRGDDLIYVAHTGGGFNEKTLAKLYQLMQPLKTNECPFKVKPKTNEPMQWVKPTLVAELKFSEWTADGKMRQPIFLGLREDKKPTDCRFEFEGDTDKAVAKAEKRRKR